jgi:hypothetical protein
LEGAFMAMGTLPPTLQEPGAPLGGFSIP